MKKIIIIWLCIFPLGLYAQKDKKAKELLDVSSEMYSKSGGMSAYFTLNIKDPKKNLTESFDGTILLKDIQFYFSTPDIDTWFNGKTQWVWMKTCDEVNISEPDENDMPMMTPAAAYSAYKSGYDAKYIGEKKDIKQRTVYEIELTPSNKKDEIARIRLQLNKIDYMPVTFHVYNKSGLEYIVYINTYQTGLNHPDYLFVFDQTKYPDVEIIDLR